MLLLQYWKEVALQIESKYEVKFILNTHYIVLEPILLKKKLPSYTMKHNNKSLKVNGITKIPEIFLFS